MRIMPQQPTEPKPAVRYALRHGPRSAVTTAILAFLADRADHDGIGASATDHEIADRFGLTRQQVRRHLDKLMDDGYLREQP